MIAGPCAVESLEGLDRIAAHVKKAGANILRGGGASSREPARMRFRAWVRKGLKILRDVGDKHDMPVVTEVMDPRQVSLVEKWADMFQIGARNMQNFDLLEGSRPGAQAGLAQARHERDRERPADVRGIRASRRQPGRRPVRARRAQLRGFDAQHARHERRAECEGPEPPADHRRPEPRDRPARSDSERWPRPPSPPGPTAFTSKSTIVRRKPSPTARKRCCPISLPA